MAILSDDVLKEINEYVYDQGLAWAKGFIQYNKASLESKKIKASGTLIQSFQEEITSQLQQSARVRIEIAFDVHGRFVDMKGLKPPKGGEDYIKGLEDWLEEKGLAQRFTNSLVRKRNLRKVPPNILNQLAWSVAIARSKRFQRQKKWYNKPKQAAITELYNKVAANLPERVAAEIKKAFQQ